MTNAEPTKKDGLFPFKVNGEELSAKSQVLLAREILEIAAAHGAMPGKPDEYLLQGDKGPQNGRYSPDDPVDLVEDNVFITVPHTPTPVA